MGVTDEHPDAPETTQSPLAPTIGIVRLHGVASAKGALDQGTGFFCCTHLGSPFTQVSTDEISDVELLTMLSPRAFSTNGNN